MRAPFRYQLGPWTFVGELPCELAKGFDGREQPAFDAEDVSRFEGLIVAHVAENGLLSPETFRFLRSKARLTQAELAQLLDTNAETISRWESGKSGFDRGTWYTVAALAMEHIQGDRRTEARLRRVGGTPAGEIKLAS